MNNFENQSLNNQTEDTESSDASLLMERPLLSIEQYADRENVSITTVESCARLGIIQIRRHKGKRFIVDVPPSPHSDAEITDGHLDFKKQSQKVSEIVKRILPDKSQQNQNTPQEANKSAPEIKPGSIADLVQKMVQKSAMITGKPIDALLPKEMPSIRVERPKLVDDNSLKIVKEPAPAAVNEPLNILEQVINRDKLNVFDNNLTKESKKIINPATVLPPSSSAVPKAKTPVPPPPAPIQKTQQPLTTAQDILKLINKDAKPNVPNIKPPVAEKPQIQKNVTADFNVVYTQEIKQQENKTLNLDDEIRLIEDVYEPLQPEKPQKIKSSIPDTVDIKDLDKEMLLENTTIDMPENSKLLITIEKTRKIVAIVILVLFTALVVLSFWLFSDRTTQINKLNNANSSINNYLQESEKINEVTKQLENKLDGKVTEAEQLRKDLENSKTELSTVYNDLSKTKENFDSIRQRNTQAVERLNQRIQQLSTRLTELQQMQEMQAAPKAEPKK